MTNIILCGCGGKMGQAIVRAAADSTDTRIVAGVDINADSISAACTFPVYQSISDFPGKADIIVDFSHHTALTSILSYAKTTLTPVVIATTGHTEEETALIKKCANIIPIFHAANMSLGVALLIELAKITAKTFPDADIEIIEKHHNRKLDAPSGTALLLANAIKSVRRSLQFVYGRSGNAKRTEHESGIHAVRMGNIVGEHEVIVGTDTQTITLKHEAHNRSLFAEGAVAAAEYLVKRPAGLYDMNRMITGD